MKSERGVTLTSVIIYVLAFVVVVGTLGRISTYFYHNVKTITSETGVEAEYVKLNTYITEEINIEGNEVKECGEDKDTEEKYIVFSKTRNQYIYKSNGIYRGNNDNQTIIKICKNIDECTFSYDEETKVITITVTVNGKEKTTSYTVYK